MAAATATKLPLGGVISPPTRQSAIAGDGTGVDSGDSDGLVASRRGLGKARGQVTPAV
jgi:hypothetical protein